MFKDIPNIQINNSNYSKKELQKVCASNIEDKNLDDWEKEIYIFLTEWLSDSEFITVKTSGSTGTPKNINLLKKHMIISAQKTLSFFNLKKNDSIWLCLPANYIAGKMIIVRAIVGELNLLYSKPAAPPMLTTNGKIKFAAMVPNQVIKLLSGNKGINQLKNITHLLIGGDAITKNLYNSIVNSMPCNVWHSYGMTETITHIAIKKITNKSANYIPLQGVLINTNAQSQLVINAPDIGVNNLITNDIANVFDDGSFEVVGRLDNVIISGGVKFYPELIEEKLSKDISAPFFIGGIPDEILGNKIVLFIESSCNGYYQKNVMDALFKDKLFKYERPKEVVYLNDFLRTSTGKVKRKDVIMRYLSTS